MGIPRAPEVDLLSLSAKHCHMTAESGMAASENRHFRAEIGVAPLGGRTRTKNGPVLDTYAIGWP
jgi:hypothetical protein